MTLRLLKSIFCLALAIQTNVAFSQHIGLTFATPRWIALDHIVERYNATRPWLDQEMKQLHTLPGFQIGLGSLDLKEKMGVGLELLRFQYVRKTVRAEFGESYRELRASLSTLSISGFQWYPINKEKFAIGIGAYPVEVSVFKVRSRTDLEPKFETFHKTFTFLGLPNNASTTFKMDFLFKSSSKSRLGLSLRMYYSLFWFTEDSMIFVNEELNPQTFSEHHQEQIIRNSHGGFQILLNFISK